MAAAARAGHRRAIHRPGSAGKETARRTPAEPFGLNLPGLWARKETSRSGSAFQSSYDKKVEDRDALGRRGHECLARTSI